MGDTFFPEKEKIRELRSLGIAPWSMGVTRCAILATALWMLFPLANRLPQQRGELVAALFSPDGYRVALQAVASCIVATSLVAIGVSLIVSLLQTRLTLVLSLLSPRFRAPQRVPLIVAVSAPFFGAVAAGAMLWTYSGDVLGLIRRGDASFVAGVLAIASHGAGLLIASSCICFVVAGVAEQFLFLYRNRVTRRERESSE